MENLFNFLITRAITHQPQLSVTTINLNFCRRNLCILQSIDQCFFVCKQDKKSAGATVKQIVVLIFNFELVSWSILV